MSFFQLGQKNFKQMIKAHFGEEPTNFPIVSEQFEKYNHPVSNFG